ncbi:hypothetical protein ACGFS9_18920 [Streptomyces sp. NPDC048566]|uniref:hypothetical protein n=1 Tax=Streptomyces sp. NPDC048566 TaxID=3365569 RepID=UPI0037148311
MAWVTALVLFAEAVGVALLNWFLGVVVDRQDMSLAGLDPDAMALSSKIGGLVFGLYFAACAVTALLAGVRDRAPGLPGRVLLISAAVVHALLGAFTVGLVGWGAFAFMMVVFGLVVFTLLAYDRREPGPAGAVAPGGGDGAGTVGAQGAGPGDGGGREADHAAAPPAGTVDLGKGADPGGRPEGGAPAGPPAAPSAP